MVRISGKIVEEPEMLMSPIEPPLPFGSHRIIRLLRRWAAGAELGPARLPSLVRLGARIGVQPEAAVALASMFQLTEACLGRPLVAECCCSPRLSRDERATLLMLATAAPAHPHQADPAVPHGLPGALLWAVASARKLLGLDTLIAMARPRQCPFADR
jgi:hypothetical protein